MSLLSEMRKLWGDSGVGSCIEGVVRESGRGNVLEAQKWYFKLRKDCLRLAIKEGVLPATIHQRGLDNVGPEVAARYQAIVEECLRPGGPFVEIEEWVKKNPDSYRLS